MEKPQAEKEKKEKPRFAGRGGPGKRRKPGGGPKKKENPYTCPVSTYVTADDGESLAAWAKTEGVSKAEIARRAIEQLLRENQFL